MLSLSFDCNALRNAVLMSYIANTLTGRHASALLLNIIGLPRSTFSYKPKTKDHNNTQQRILALYRENKGRDGYRMIWIKPRKEGIFLGGKTVLGLISEMSDNFVFE